MLVWVMYLYVKSVDLRRGDAVASSTMTVSISGRVDGEDNSFAVCCLSAVEYLLRGCVVRVEVHLLKGDLVVCLEPGDFFHCQTSVDRRLRQTQMSALIFAFEKLD